MTAPYPPRSSALANVKQLGWDTIHSGTWEYLENHHIHVAILAPPLDTIPSPQGNAIYLLVERLAAKLDISCVVLAKWPESGRPSVCNISDRILYYRPKLNPSPLESTLPYRVKKMLWGAGAPFYLRYARAAANACACLRIGLLMVEDLPAFCAPVRQALPDARLILHQHINAPLKMPSRHWRRAQASTDAIVFVAQVAAREISAKHGPMTAPYQVIYNGVDLAHFDPRCWQREAEAIRSKLGIKPGAPCLLYVGRIVPGKGPLEAVHGFLGAQVPDAHFLVVGDLVSGLFADADYSRRLQTEAAASQTIHLLGAIPQEVLPAYYTIADVVIVPSIQAEGLPKVITEALAMGKPVIASDRGGSWELLDATRNGWLLADTRDLATTSRIIQDALGDRDRLRQMSERILETDRPRMDEHRMINEFSDLMSKLISAST